MIDVKALDLKDLKIKYLAFFIGTSLITPTLYHSIGANGLIFLPIFLSLTVGSFFLSPIALGILAILSPVFNSILFGMPSGMMVYVLVFEGLIFALSTMKIRNVLVNFLIARASSIVLILFLSQYSLQIWSRNFILGVPGIALNCLLALAVAKAFKKLN